MLLAGKGYQTPLLTVEKLTIFKVIIYMTSRLLELREFFTSKKYSFRKTRWLSVLKTCRRLYNERTTFVLKVPFVHFQSHKTVSLRKSSAFSFWHASWVRQNVPDTAHHSIEQWFMGKSDQLVPNRTQKLSRSSQEKAPYRQYLRYKVDLPKAIPNENAFAVGVTSSMPMLSTS